MESIILNPVDYAKAVKVIGNVEDITKVVDLMGWLPNQVIMSVTVSFSASTGKQLSEKDLKEVHKLADEILELDNSK